jgi:translation initiation factor 1
MNSSDWKSQLTNLIATEPDLQTPHTEKSPEEKKPFRKQTFFIQFEKKGRGGKQVTIISGFEGTENELKELASELKKVCGVGGSARGNEILIQGDFREKIDILLKNMGHKTKRGN